MFLCCVEEIIGALVEDLYSMPHGQTRSQQKPKPVVIGFCTSHACIKRDEVYRGVQKTADKRKSDCPDCGMVLVFKKLRNNETVMV